MTPKQEAANWYVRGLTGVCNFLREMSNAGETITPTIDQDIDQAIESLCYARAKFLKNQEKKNADDPQ